MQELDINKPMMFRDEEVKDVKHLVDFISEFGFSRAFLVTALNGTQFITYRDKNGRRNQTEDWYDDIINIPEQPEFSWDKPIRHKLSGDICVLKSRDNVEDSYPWSLVFKRPSGGLWASDYNDDGEAYIGRSCRIENFEMTSSLRVNPFDINYFPWSYTVQDERTRAYIAAFISEKDAELFKQAKE